MAADKAPMMRIPILTRLTTLVEDEDAVRDYLVRFEELLRSQYLTQYRRELREVLAVRRSLQFTRNSFSAANFSALPSAECSVKPRRATISSGNASLDEQITTCINNRSARGYMLKKGSGLAGWKRRYFVLRGSLLKYFTEQRGAIKGAIVMTDADVKQSGQTLTLSGPHARRTFVIKAPTENAATQWGTLLKRAAAAEPTAAEWEDEYDGNDDGIEITGTTQMSTPFGDEVATDKDIDNSHPRSLKSEIFWEGSLLHKGQGVSLFYQRRYFVLNGPEMFVFDKKGGLLVQKLQLKQAQVKVTKEEKQITVEGKDGQARLQCETPEEFAVWKKNLDLVTQQP